MAALFLTILAQQCGGLLMLERIRPAIIEIAAHDLAVRQRLEEMGGEARGSSAQEMTSLVASELQRWTQVVADAKIPRL